MKCLILYWSAGGNTKKVADSIADVLKEKDISVDLIEIDENLKIDIYEYDLVFMGAPSYQWIPPMPVQKFIKNTINRSRNGVRPIGCPRKKGKFGIVFCTYSGIHTGLHEGIVAGKYMGQFFEHMGFFVLDEWYTPGKFQGWEEGSKKGKLGNISNRPNKEDLDIIQNNTQEILQGISYLL